jgi:hypothetical protein
MSGTANSALDALLFNWGEAYRIDIIDDEWIAWLRDGQGKLTSASADEFHMLMRDDCTFRPVPRNPEDEIRSAWTACQPVHRQVGELDTWELIRAYYLARGIVGLHPEYRVTKMLANYTFKLQRELEKRGEWSSAEILIGEYTGLEKQ